jgi:hypothetical protein
MVDEAEFDVAISLLGRDERIGAELRNRLEGLQVFFFPRNQEELAGKDGMETLRQPFLNSRVNVVLYREQWGKTKWTAVEERAIKERCFEGDWPSLFVIVLDRRNKLPGWLPPSYICLDWENYGIEQTIGAIKARVQERGGTIKRPDAVSRARIVQSQAEFAADRERLFRDGPVPEFHTRCSQKHHEENRANW